MFYMFVNSLTQILGVSVDQTPQSLHLHWSLHQMIDFIGFHEQGLPLIGTEIPGKGACAMRHTDAY